MLSKIRDFSEPDNSHTSSVNVHVRQFFANTNVSNDVLVKKLAGIDPVRAFELPSKHCRLGEESPEGIGPVSMLSLTRNTSKVGLYWKLGGIDPVKKFSSAYTILILVQLVAGFKYNRSILNGHRSIPDVLTYFCMD